MTSISAIFTPICHTKQLNPWPNLSASCVVIHSWLSAYQGKMGPFEGYLSTHGQQTGLRKGLSESSCMLYQLRMTQKVEPIQLQPPHFLGPIVIFWMIMLICLRIYFNRAVSYILCSNRAVLHGITNFGAYNMDTQHVQNYTLFGTVSVLLPPLCYIQRSGCYM